jgi:hypothetical protein
MVASIISLIAFIIINVFFPRALFLKGLLFLLTSWRTHDVALAMCPIGPRLALQPQRVSPVMHSVLPHALFHTARFSSIEIYVN